MRCKNDEKTQIEHYMKKQIDFAYRIVTRHKHETWREKTNK